MVNQDPQSQVVPGEPGYPILRPGRIGDWCVLLAPSPGAPSEYLASHQRALQEIYGGEITPQVHLTCRRFAVKNEATVSRFIHLLTSALPKLRPFPVTASSLFTMYSPFHRSNILKWRIAPTEKLLRFCMIIERVVQEAGFSSFYVPGMVPTQVTALENVQLLSPEREPVGVYIPSPLFWIERVLVSRVEDRKDLNIVADFELENL